MTTKLIRRHSIIRTMHARVVEPIEYEFFHVKPSLVEHTSLAVPKKNYENIFTYPILMQRRRHRLLSLVPATASICQICSIAQYV